MADPFSIAASSFAVVGTVDVVTRLSIECYRFLSDIKNAPEEINTLRICIMENKKLMSSLQAHVVALSSSSQPASASFSPPTPELEGCDVSLKALKRELDALSNLAKKYVKADKAWATIKFVLAERRISKCLEKLERAKTSLSLALAVLQGSQSIIGLKNTDIAMKQGFQQIDATMVVQAKELSAVRTNQEKLANRQEKLVLQSTQQIKHTRLLDKKIQGSSRQIQVEHTRTRHQIADGNRDVINSIASKLDELRIGIPKKARISGREIKFVGDKRDPVLASLLLIKEQVRSTILEALSDKAGHVLPQQLLWLQTEFETLVSSATQEAASFCQGSTATSFDNWEYSSMGDMCPSKIFESSRVTAPSNPDCGQQKALTGHREHGRDRLPGYKVFQSRTAIGTLELRLRRTADGAHRMLEFEEAHLSFIPSKGIMSNSIQVHLDKSKYPNLTPKLYAQINSFRIVDNNKLHIKLFQNGSIEEIDNAFRRGIISPYDQYKGLLMSAFAASLSRRYDILEYLESQGIGYSALRSSADVVHASVYSMVGKPSASTDIEMHNLIKSKLCAEEWTADLSILLSIFKAQISFGDSSDEDFQEWMSLLKFLANEGCDLDATLSDGRTVLAHALSYQGERLFSIVLLLLELGASPHAVDDNGWTTIHWAIFSVKKDEIPSVLQEKLSLLVKLGVDIHNRRKGGFTPSRYARYYGCWQEWCNALERNGINIEDVLREDDELDLLKENSDEEYEYESEEYSDEGSEANLEPESDEEPEDDSG